MDSLGDPARSLHLGATTPPVTTITTSKVSDNLFNISQNLSIQTYRFFLTATPLKVLSIRLHSKSHKSVRIYFPAATFRGVDVEFAHMVQMSVVAAKRGMSSVHVRASELYSLDMHQGPAARRIPIYAVDSD